MAGELAKNKANIFVSGMAAFGIQKTTTDAGFCNLMTVYGKKGIVTIKELDGGAPDTYGRPRPASYGFEAMVDVPVVKTVANQLALLQALSEDEIEGQITTRAGGSASIPRYFSSAATGLPGTWGFKWKVIADKSMDDNMYLHVEARRKYTEAEYLLLLASSVTNPVPGTPGVSDTFKTLLSMTGSDVATSGIRSITLGSGADEVGVKEGGKFTAELITTLDDDGEDTTDNTVKITLEVNAKQTGDAEMTRWNTVSFALNTWVVTFASGLIWTPNLSNLGLITEYHHDNDSNKNQFIKATAVGYVTPKQFCDGWSNVA